MTSLLALFLVGCLIVVLGFRALFRMLKPREMVWEFPEINLMELVELRALSFQNSSRLFSNTDYRLLRAEPRLGEIAKRLRIDRRQLALQWLAAVRSDVSSLWRLRRLLAAYGVSEGTMVELSITVEVIFILAWISALRLCVFLLGPFAFHRIVAMGRRQVETYSRCCRSTLARLPRNKWPQFKAEWLAQQV